MTSPSADPVESRPNRRWSTPAWGWATLGPLAALAAFHGALSNTELLYVRDLAGYCWPEHLWLRGELLAGRYPLWDPYVSFGQPAVSDPNRELMFPPTLLLRVALPEVLGFNLTVVVPFLLLAAGAYLFLRRHVSQQASALGAVALTISGPAISMGNFLNFPWAFAFVPWALYATDLLAERVTPRRFAGLAVTFALLFLAGESATLVAGAALTVAYAAAATSGEATGRARARTTLVVLAAGLVSLPLVAAQILPLAETVGQSVRAVESNQRILSQWSLHPLSLVEALVAQVFGNPLAPFGGGGAWTTALNKGREPLMFSIYVGVGLLGLGAVGALAARSRRISFFWVVVLVCTLVAAIGDHLPIYPALKRAVPLLGSVRYSSKYIVFAALALAVLSALGWDALATGYARDARRALLRAAVAAVLAVGAIALGFTAWGLVSRGSLSSALEHLAAAVGSSDPALAATYAANAALISGPQLFALALGTAACLWLGASPGADRARALLFALVALDLLVANANLLPTLDARLLGEPEWAAVVRRQPHDRVYVAGRLSSTFNSGPAPDLPFGDRGIPVSEHSPAADMAITNAFLASLPSAWKVRDSVSFDNSLLYPRLYWDTLLRFSASPREERARFLRRVGVRYYLVPWEELEGATLVQSFPDRPPLLLYERAPAVGRVAVVATARIEPNERAQIDRLLAEEFDPASEVLLSSPSDGPAGAASAPCGPSAEILSDGGTSLSVRACVPEAGGYLVLLDSFDPNWQAEVDGERAPVLRANTLFRAVHLSPGSHTVRFVYRPRRFWIGSIVSGVTALFLVAACFVRRRRILE